MYWRGENEKLDDATPSVSAFVPSKQLNFLIAGFARSGTTSVAATLATHPQISMAFAAEKTAEQDSAKKSKFTRDDFEFINLSFNWPPLLQVRHLESFEKSMFFRDQKAVQLQSQLLRGGKSEGFPFSRHVDFVRRTLSAKLKLILVLREPIQWLQSVFNLRTHLRCEQEGLESRGCVYSGLNATPAAAVFLDVAAGRRSFEDATRGGGRYGDVLLPLLTSGEIHNSGKNGEPTKLDFSNVLLLEFAELKRDPSLFFKRITPSAKPR